jgi:transposase
MHFSKLCPALSSPHTSFGLADLSVELNRGAMSIKVSWPVSAPGACVLWVREVMR